MVAKKEVEEKEKVIVVRPTEKVSVTAMLVALVALVIAVVALAVVAYAITAPWNVTVVGLSKDCSSVQQEKVELNHLYTTIKHTIKRNLKLVWLFILANNFIYII